MNSNKDLIKKTILLKSNSSTNVLTDSDSTVVVDDIVSNVDFSRNLVDKSGDIYINILLIKTFEVFEYVDVKKDEKKYVVDRQLVNPYYMNFGFFNGVKRIKVNKSFDLTEKMINYLITEYPESIELWGGDVNSWFDEVGYNMLINDIKVSIDGVTGKKTKENGLDRLEKLELSLDSVISKAFFFPIEVNK